MMRSPISLLVQGNDSHKRKTEAKIKAEKRLLLDDTGAAYEEVKKDSSALSKEEQMDVLYR